MGPLSVSDVFTTMDLSFTNMALPCFLLGMLIARCIPGILGGVTSLWVSCRQIISAPCVMSSAAFSRVKPSILKLRMLSPSTGGFVSPEKG